MGQGIQDRIAETGEIDRTLNITAWTGQWVQESWQARVLRQAAEKEQAARDNRGRTAITGKIRQDN